MALGTWELKNWNKAVFINLALNWSSRGYIYHCLSEQKTCQRLSTYAIFWHTTTLHKVIRKWVISQIIYSQEKQSNSSDNQRCHRKKCPGVSQKKKKKKKKKNKVMVKRIIKFLKEVSEKQSTNGYCIGYTPI